MNHAFTEAELAEGLTVECEVCKQPAGKQCVSAVDRKRPCTFGMHFGRIERSARKVERPWAS